MSKRERPVSADEVVRAIIPFVGELNWSYAENCTTNPRPCDGWRTILGQGGRLGGQKMLRHSVVEALRECGFDVTVAEPQDDDLEDGETQEEFSEKIIEGDDFYEYLPLDCPPAEDD